MRTKNLLDGVHAMTTENRELLTQKQVCELFHVCPKTVERWRKGGRLRAITLGRSMIRIPREAIAEFIAAGKTEQVR